MRRFTDWIKRRSGRGEPWTATGDAPVLGARASGLLPTLALAFVSLLAASLLNGTVVFLILRLGAGSGLPSLEFKGAVALALLGSWFSMGTSNTKTERSQDLLESVAGSLAHQLGSALLMLALLGTLSFGFGMGGR